MTGLLLKDLLSLKKAGSRIAVFMVMYIIIFASSGNLTFLSAMITIIMTMFVLNTFAYDELCKWDYFALSLPVTKRQIVLSKYALAFLFALFGVLVSLLIYLSKGQINLEITATLCIVSAISLLISSVMLPLIFKLGTQKARIWMVLIFLLPSVGITLLGNLGWKLSTNVPVSNSTVETLIVLALPAALIIFALSYFLSCNIFSRKEI